MTPFWKKDKDRELPPDFLDQASRDRRADSRDRSAPPAQRRATPPPETPAGEPRREPMWRDPGTDAPAAPSRPYPSRPKRVSNAEAGKPEQPTAVNMSRPKPESMPPRTADSPARKAAPARPEHPATNATTKPSATPTPNATPERRATHAAKPRAWQATIPVDHTGTDPGSPESDSVLSFATSAPPPPPPTSSRRRKRPEHVADTSNEAETSQAASTPERSEMSVADTRPGESTPAPATRQPSRDATTARTAASTPDPVPESDSVPTPRKAAVDRDEALNDVDELDIPIAWEEASKYDNPYRPGGGGESVEAVLRRGSRSTRASFAAQAVRESTEATSALLDDAGEDAALQRHAAGGGADLSTDDAGDDWVEAVNEAVDEPDLAFADEPAWMQDDMAAEDEPSASDSGDAATGFNRFSLDEAAAERDDDSDDPQPLWVEPGSEDRAASKPQQRAAVSENFDDDDEATWEGESNPWRNSDEQVRYGARPNPRVSTTLFNFGDTEEDASADNEAAGYVEDDDDDYSSGDDLDAAETADSRYHATGHEYRYQTPGVPGNEPAPAPQDEDHGAVWREEEPASFETAGLRAATSAPLPQPDEPVFDDQAEYDDVTAPPPAGGGFGGDDFGPGNGNGFGNGNGHDDGYGGESGDGYGYDGEYGDGEGQHPPQEQDQVIMVEDEDGHAHKTLYMNGDVDEYAEDYYDEDEDYEDEIPEEEEPDEIAKAEAGLPLAGHTNERNGWGYTFVIATLFTMFGSITIATYFVVMNTNASIPNIMVNVSVFALLFFILILFNRYFVLIFLSFLHHVRIKDFENSKEDFEPLKATILVPAYNEGVVIESSIESLLKLNYPNYEIVVINDGSSDDTLEKAKLWEGMHDTAEVRVLTQRNKGKAAALNHGAAMARGDVVVCMDGDSRLTPDTLGAGMRYFDDPEVGAVAGNVKVVNRRNVLTRLQALEYVEGLNLVRRAQAYLNAVNIVPGPIGLFRRDILLQVGGWDTDTFAEDCDLTLKILTSGYKIEYEPYAISETEAPESLIPLLKQRYRWTRGILQSMRKHRSFLINPDAGWRVVITMWQMVLEGILWPLMNILANMMFMLVAFLFGMSPLLVLWWVQLTILDTIAALHALAIEREDLTLVPYAVIYRLVFIQIVDVTKMLATIEELLGIKMGWGKLERKGRLT